MPPAPRQDSAPMFTPKWKKEAKLLHKGAKKFLHYKRDLLKPDRIDEIESRRADLMDAPGPGGLGGTYAGNPLACAAALAVLDIFERDGLMERGRAVGQRLRNGLVAIAGKHKTIGEVRGLGPMIALELAEQSPDRAKAVVDAAFERGLLLLACGVYGNVLRLLPALTIADDELEEGLALLDDAFAAAA